MTTQKEGGTESWPLMSPREPLSMGDLSTDPLLSELLAAERPSAMDTQGWQQGGSPENRVRFREGWRK